MTLREKLLGNYQSELEFLTKQQIEGINQVDSETWDFEETSTLPHIPIQQVIDTVNLRIAILSDPDLTDEEAEEFNY